MAREGEIIISQRFYDEIKNQPAVDPQEALELKGKVDKVNVYRVKR